MAEGGSPLGEWQAGDICSVRGEHAGVYSVAKVLAVDDVGIHVRLFANRFADRPSTVDTTTLSLGTVEDEHFGIGHLPLHPTEWERWEPELIQHGSVDAEELDGYEVFREAQEQEGAGVWGDPHDAPAIARGFRRLFRRR